jgi:hypothetical protein
MVREVLVVSENFSPHPPAIPRNGQICVFLKKKSYFHFLGMNFDKTFRDCRPYKDTSTVFLKHFNIFEVFKLNFRHFPVN